MNKKWQTTVIARDIAGERPSPAQMEKLHKALGGEFIREGVFKDRPVLAWKQLSDFEKVLSTLTDDPNVGVFQIQGAGNLRPADPLRGRQIIDPSRRGASWASMDFGCAPLRFDHQRQGRLYSASLQLFDGDKMPCAGAVLRDFWHKALLAEIPHQWEIHLDGRSHLPTMLFHRITKTELLDMIGIINSIQGIEMFTLLVSAHDRQAKQPDGHIKTGGFSNSDDWERFLTVFDLPAGKLKEIEQSLNAADNQSNAKDKEQLFNN